MEDLTCCTDCACAVESSDGEPSILSARARRYAEAAAEREESSRHVITDV